MYDSIDSHECTYEEIIKCCMSVRMLVCLTKVFDSTSLLSGLILYCVEACRGLRQLI